jgi:hypothetical protein
LAGTSTPTPTYTDAGGLTPNANPVILDSRGEASIFFDSTTIYKITLQDATGAALWTQDNLGANPVAAYLTAPGPIGGTTPNTISGTTGTFSGAVSGTTGTFAGAVSGTTGTFSGAVAGTTGTFSGAVSGTTFNGQLLNNPQIISVSASVATNVLTVGMAGRYLDFRSTTLATGTATTILAGALSLTVPSSATLGTVSAQASRIVLLAINNAGTIELAVVNLSGGVNLDETTLINTTAISAGATAANVVYSTTARTGVAFRVVGFVDSTQATAGTWATAPSLVQGSGGQALAAMSSIGYGQTWQNLLGVGGRAINTTLYNTSGRPIQVVVGGTLASVAYTLVVGGVTASSTTLLTGNALQAQAIVPPGASYAFNGASGAAGFWAELR